MNVENISSETFFLGDVNYRSTPGSTIEVPDSVYNTNNDVAQAINSLDEANKVTVTSAPVGYPRSTSETSGGGLSEAEVEALIETNAQALIDTHSADTTAVHGIADVATLQRRPVQVKLFDDTTNASTGDGKFSFLIPPEYNGLNLVDADAMVSTVSSSGTPTVAVRRERSGSAVDMLSTNITIDANEKTSYTAATAPVINTSNDDVATGDIIHIDVDAAGTGAKGLAVVLVFA